MGSSIGSTCPSAMETNYTSWLHLDQDLDMEPPLECDYVNRRAIRSRRDIPFRFLDLPKEVRLMCYEFLPEKVTHYFTPAADCTVAVSDKCFNPAILSTCSIIYEEARDILFNAMHHNGPQVSLAYRGPEIDHLLLILDHGLLARLPLKQRIFRDSKSGISRHIMEKCLPFNTRLFALRSYMRTPKDHEVHINWQPVNEGLPEREYLARFVKDMARLYCLITNRPYTVSILEGKSLVPLEDFIRRRIWGFSSRFQEKLALDGLTTWMDLFHRASGIRRTSRWLWPQER